jgi:hypothetical protein
MFIIFDRQTKTIYSYGSGNPIESENKLYLGNAIICNDLTICNWKYIADQRLEQDENGFVHDADYYPVATKPVTVEDLQEQLAATNAVLLDIYLGGL